MRKEKFNESKKREAKKRKKFCLKLQNLSAKNKK